MKPVHINHLTKINHVFVRKNLKQDLDYVAFFVFKGVNTIFNYLMQVFKACEELYHFLIFLPSDQNNIIILIVCSCRYDLYNFF